MPLLNKRLFEPNPAPDDLDPNVQVWYCNPTNEIFFSHEEYFNRMVLLNSTVWTCTLTRKTNLTYFEAVASEAGAERELCDFPSHLEVPILFIVNKMTNRGRFEELVNDVYHIMKDRYFNQEEVVFTERSRKFNAKIISSRLEGEDDTMIYRDEIREPVLPPARAYLYSVRITDPLVPDGERLREGVTCDKLFRPKSVGARQKVRLFLKNACHLPASGDRYSIKDAFLEKVENMQWIDFIAGPEAICPQTPVQQRGRIPNMMKPGYVEVKKERRAKKEEKDPNTPSKPRGRPPKTPEQKALAVEEKKRRKTDRTREGGGQETSSIVSRMSDFCLTSSGAMTLEEPIPAPTKSPPKKKPRTSAAKNEAKKKAKIQEQQQDLDFFFSEAHRLGIDVSALEQKEKVLSGKAIADFKQIVKDAKEAEREKQKEEKKKKQKEKQAYAKKREDIICDDLKPMPRFPQLELPEWMSEEEFSDFIFLTQFFSSFGELLPLKEIRGNEEVPPFSEIVLAIKCNDPQKSPFADLIRVLLSARTDIADEEDGDEADISNRDEIALINAQSCDPINAMHGDSIRQRGELHHKIRKIHGKSVRHLPVDWMTLSEVLRLVFETSGYYTGIATHRHRLYARGNFRGYEDPAFELRSTRPEILEKLRTQTVFDLEPDERMLITKVLIYQLLSYSKFRAHIDAHILEMNELKKEQKKLKAWDIGQEADANAARLLLEVNEPNESRVVKTPTESAKRFKSHLKAIKEGRRYDKDDMESIFLEAVPFFSLDIDEIVTARQLQRVEYKKIMDVIIEKIFAIHSKVCDVRLGSDRAQRRFIVVESLSVILIENPPLSEQLIPCTEPSNISNPEYTQETETHEVFMCSGDMDSCSVHGTKRLERPRWCYVDSQEKLEQLLHSLNSRGIRESELIEHINELRPSLFDMLTETEEDGWKKQFMTDESDPADSYNIDWDDEMRDLLLDFEEKIEQGQMGSLEKTFGVERAVWRQTLKDHGNVTGLLKENLKVGSEIVVNLEEAPHYSDVRNLATAFFLTVRTINYKFIKAPFLSPNRDEHGNLKASELFTRWQKALVMCESLSALSLFISTFEGSIKWDKSRLQGKCRSCRRKATAHELILCTGCDSCFHLKCAKLSEQVDEWLCTACRAQQRKAENEERRRNRLDTDNGYNPDESQDHESEGSSSGSNSQNIPATPQTIRTSSGRAVKRVHYSDVHEGIQSPRSRKSNGAVATTPSEKPVRSTSSTKVFGEDEYLSDEESDGENASKRRKKKRLNTTSDVPVVTPVRNAKEKMSAIESLLKETMRQECSWPFLQPVDPKEVPDYYDVIKRPMDLRTMINKIKQRIYNYPAEVLQDFRLILSNCQTYNETDSEIYKLSEELEAFAASRLDGIINQ